MDTALVQAALIDQDSQSGPDDRLSVEQFQQALPKKWRGRVSPQVMSGINDVLADENLRDNFRDNLISYTSVLMGGKYKLLSYVDAVKYVSFKMMGYNNKDSWAKTFPVRFLALVASGTDDKTMSSYVSAYSKNKLVNAILEQTLIPVHILNADAFQKAINCQLTLMTTSTSDKVKCDAANSLLTHLKQPEVKHVELNLGAKDSQTIAELKEVTQKLAAVQLEQIKKGAMSAQEVAHSRIVIDGHTGEEIKES